MVHHLMVRYMVSIRHFLTLHSVNKTLFETIQCQKVSYTRRADADLPPARGRLRRGGHRAQRAPRQPRAAPGSGALTRALRVGVHTTWGGWMRYTPRFPKDPWEIMKIYEISLIVHHHDMDHEI